MKPFRRPYAEWSLKDNAFDHCWQCADGNGRSPASSHCLADNHSTLNRPPIECWFHICRHFEKRKSDQTGKLKLGIRVALGIKSFEKEKEFSDFTMSRMISPDPAEKNDKQAPENALRRGPLLNLMYHRCPLFPG
jgi:hypothetical protein